MDKERVLTPEIEDALPERCRYRDEGCELASSCLECPFPQCIYDIPAGGQTLLKEQRDAEIARLYRDEKRPVKELAQTFGLSARSVQRVVKKYGVRHENLRKENNENRI